MQQQNYFQLKNKSGNVMKLGFNAQGLEQITADVHSLLEVSDFSDNEIETIKHQPLETICSLLNITMESKESPFTTGEDINVFNHGLMMETKQAPVKQRTEIREHSINFLNYL